MNHHRRESHSRSLLYKDRENGIIMGICAGLADYFDTHVFVTRGLALVALYLFFFPTIFAYLIAGLLLKDKPLVYRGRGSETSFWGSHRRNSMGGS